MSRRVHPVRRDELARDPFSLRSLAAIFRVNSDDPNRVRSRESSWLEFKENFNWASWQNYGRTCAAFANAEGGYIVFGVKNSPRELLGMSNTAFDDTPPEKLSEDLNSTFSPEIRWERYVHEANGRKFGLLYVHKCSNKPVIATKTIRDGKQIREGEIYYRYRGRSERIRYAELRAIIEERQQINMDRWLEFLRKAARVGIDNAAVLDTELGVITGSGGKLVIDEELLEKVKFIQEGQFREREGEPTLRLIGDVMTIPSGVIQPIQYADRVVAIRTPDIVHAFLEQRDVVDPCEYIRQMPYESSAFLPIYYFMKLASLSVAEAVNFIESQQSRSRSQSKLLERLTDDVAKTRVAPSTTHPTGVKIHQYREDLLGQRLDESGIPPEDIRCVLRALRMLNVNEIDSAYLFPILKNWFDRYYSVRDANLADELRRAICYLDYTLNYPGE